MIKDLVETASYYFTSGIILKHFKESITIVLYNNKKGGGKYFLLSNYKPITFKNMLIKVLKKYIVNIIFKVVKKYRLFLWNQIGVKRKYFTLLIVKLFSFYVQIA